MRAACMIFSMFCLEAMKVFSRLGVCARALSVSSIVEGMAAPAAKGLSSTVFDMYPEMVVSEATLLTSEQNMASFHSSY